MTPHLNIISRKTANERIKNWREYATKKLNFTIKNAPKSIFIPQIDLEQIVGVFRKNDPQKRKLSGIRIYFTKNNLIDGCDIE